jgi:signal transduction histidine kinase
MRTSSPKARGARSATEAEGVHRSALLPHQLARAPGGSAVLLRVIGDATRLYFEVYDQGEGMLADEAEKVFDPFFHADRVGEERAPGAGLGLPVAKQIIEAHGGKIWAESPPKNQPDAKHNFSGAKVAFWIPARAHAPVETQPPTFVQPSPEGGTS